MVTAAENRARKAWRLDHANGLSADLAGPRTRLPHSAADPFGPA